MQTSVLVADNGFVCTLCKKMMSTRWTMKRHFETKHATSTGVAYSCPGCQKVLPNKYYFKEHLRTQHPTFTGIDIEMCLVQQEHSKLAHF